MKAALDENELVAAALARADAVVALTQSLVRLDTQTPPSDTRAAAALIERRLQAVSGVTLRRYDSEPPVANLVATVSGGAPGPRLVLNGHLDTYPIGEANGWAQDPLGGEITDGRLYGRGSADMKGGVAALVETTILFAERMRPFPGELVLALGGDEERMGELGAQWLIDHAPEVRGDGVIVADVGAPDLVMLGEKGMIWLDLSAQGRQAHGAHVHAGSNAADRLIDALVALRRLEELHPTPPEEAAAIMATAGEQAAASSAAARETMRRVTVNLGRISSGVSSNLVPARAEAGADVRIPLGLSTQVVEAEIAERLAGHPAVSYEITRRYEATWTPATSPTAKACAAAATLIEDRPARQDMRIGGSDARLWRRAGFDAVVLGLTPYNLGAPDEHLDVFELRRLAASYSVAASIFLHRDRANADDG